MDNTTWKIIDGHENYLINRDGIVRNRHTGEIMHVYTWDGYPMGESWFITLDHKTRRLHRLVAKAFVPNPNNFPVVGFKDNNPLNIKADNLCWYPRSAYVTYSRDDIRKIFGTIHQKILVDSEILMKQLGLSNVLHVERVKMAIRHMIELGIPQTANEFLGDFRPIVYRGQMDDDYQINPYGLILRSTSDRISLGAFAPIGYAMADILINGKCTKTTVHRLVAETFLPNPDKLKQVNHINGCKFDPCLWNLEWCTAQENMRHAVVTGLIPRGEKLAISVYTNELIDRVCQLLADGRYSPRKIHEMTGVTVDEINQIREGKAWKTISKNYDIKFYNYKPVTGECLGEVPRKTQRFRDSIRDFINYKAGRK